MPNGNRNSRRKWSVTRRKRVDSATAYTRRERHDQLDKSLGTVNLVGLGVGATIGAGVYILIGTVAREQTGPALIFAFFIAGIAAALSAFCYAELACRCPSAGSAYHYSYVCIGEGVAWIIGWSLILEYTVGGAAVARGISPHLALLRGGENLPALLARRTTSSGFVVDPCAVFMILIVTILLCTGIKGSVVVHNLVTWMNIFAMVFIIIVGGYLVLRNGWPGNDVPEGYFPFGLGGVLSGSATVFFSFIGFDAIASTAEEAKHPRSGLPFGIGISFCICCILYMLVSIIIVRLVPFTELDEDTPISSAFATYGMKWAVNVATAGAVASLLATLMGSLLPQPRILMAMSRDGLLPPFFSDIDMPFQVPVKSTLATGGTAAALASFLGVPQLAGMVSAGTLLAFTAVAVSLLILRYIPPNEVPIQLPISDSTASVPGESSHNVQESGEDRDPLTPATGSSHHEETGEDRDPLIPAAGSSHHEETSEDRDPLIPSAGSSSQEETGEDRDPLIPTAGSSHHEIVPADDSRDDNEEPRDDNEEPSDDNEEPLDNRDQIRRREVASWSIAAICGGALILAYAASAEALPRSFRFILGVLGIALFLPGLITLLCIDQDSGRHSFGRPGGFTCPSVPLVPSACILINTYLLVNQGASTWICVSGWLVFGVLLYLVYGRTHSSLQNAHYVPAHSAEALRQFRRVS